MRCVVQTDITPAELQDDDLGDSREERAMRNWINSMDVGAGTDSPLYINNLLQECRTVCVATVLPCLMECMC
jgi:hypothetical protein